MAPEGWNIVTVLLQVLAASGLSFCLARSSFWYIDRIPHRSEVQHHLQETSPVGFSQVRPSYMGISSFLRASSLTTELGRFTQTNYIFITTYARFTAFLTLLSALLFVICFAVLSVALSISPQRPEEGTIASLRDQATCMALIYICIGLYAMTRIFVYMFFVERVYLIRCGGIHVPRLSTTTYRCALFSFAIYFIIMVLLVVGRISNLQPSTGLDDGSVQSCIIGARLYALVPFFLFDLVLNGTLTTAFVVSILNCDKNDKDRRKLSIPLCLLKSRKQMDTAMEDRAIQRADRPHTLSHTPPQEPATSLPHPTYAPSATETDDFASWQDLVIESSHSSLRKLAVRSLIASLIGLATSCINVSVWIAHHGLRESMTCMRWCFVDVVVNAFAVAALLQARTDEAWWQNVLRSQQSPVHFLSSEDPSPLGEVAERGRAFSTSQRLGNTSPDTVAHTGTSPPRAGSRATRGAEYFSEDTINAAYRHTSPPTNSPPRRVHLPLTPNRHTSQFTPVHHVELSEDDIGESHKSRQHQPSAAPRRQPRQSLQLSNEVRVDPRRWSIAE